MSLFTVRHAEPSDIDQIKNIAYANRYILGFLTRTRIEEAVTAKRVLVSVVAEDIAGFVIYRHRKIDQQTTLSDICVVEKWRNCGVGKFLITALYTECVELGRNFIQLKCPEHLLANKFYSRVGFQYIRTEPGRQRRLNVWQLSIAD